MAEVLIGQHELSDFFMANFDKNPLTDTLISTTIFREHYATSICYIFFLLFLSEPAEGYVCIVYQ